MKQFWAIRVDMENNAEEFWTALREQLPLLAASLERNGCAVVGDRVYNQLDELGAFDGEPSPLIDYGSDGDGWTDVVASTHGVFE